MQWRSRCCPPHTYGRALDMQNWPIRHQEEDPLPNPPHFKVAEKCEGANIRKFLIKNYPYTKTICSYVWADKSIRITTCSRTCSNWMLTRTINFSLSLSLSAYLFVPGQRLTQTHSLPLAAPTHRLFEESRQTALYTPIITNNTSCVTTYPSIGITKGL